MREKPISNIAKLIVCGLLIVFSTMFAEKDLQAFHLVGGELTYECLGGNQYRVNLIIYRDCNAQGAAPFDQRAAIFLRDPNTQDYIESPNNSGLFTILADLNASDTIRVPINDDGLCTDYIPDICVSRAIYSYILNLEPRSGGYEVIHQRCCRNSSIVNISLPDETGSTYSLFIPHEDNSCDNSSPFFNNFPPIVICDGYPIYFDHSATDPDGDSLVYSLCTPSDGAFPDCPGNPVYAQQGEGPYVGHNFCTTLTGDWDGIIPSPIGSVNWLGGYSTDDPLGNPNDPLTIDPVTGLLTGTPDGEGQYVVGICVEEYRNGVLIESKIRDFQFNVTACDLIRAVPDADAEEISPGVFQITNCDDFTLVFDNQSVNATEFAWDFGVAGTNTDVSDLEFPTFTYPDTGTYNIQLVATNGSACIDTANLILKLYPTFETDFLFDTQICSHDPFQFTDVTQTTFGVVDSWYWDFGGGVRIGPGSGAVNTVGTSGSYNMPNHYYSEAGTYNVSLVTTNNLGCMDSMSHFIEVYPQPESNINYDFLCVDLPVNFSADVDLNNVVSYNWLFDGTTAATGPQAQQNYTEGDYLASLIVETDQGCKDTSLFNFTIYPEIFADAGNPQDMCFGDTILLDASNSTGGGGLNINSYQWEPSEYVIDDPTNVMPFVSPIADQFFTLSVSDPNGCTDISQVFITVYPLPDLNAGLDIPDICLGDSTRQLNGTVSPLVLDFDWSPANVLSDANILNPFIYASDTTDFVLWGIDANGCVKRDTINAIVIPPVDPMLAANDVEICQGDSIQLNASGGVEFIWEPPTGLSNPFIGNPMSSPDDDINYTIYIANPPCFEDSINLDMVVHPAPFVEAGEDATINIGETVQLSGIGDLIFEWLPSESVSDPTIEDPIAMPLQTTVYTFTTETDQGCRSSDSLTITVTNFFELILPTAFTPNGDDLNDVLSLQTRGIEFLDQFIIFNRWGQKVFETNDINEGWDGTFKGQPQELGVYVFYVQARKFLGGEFFIKGNVTLIR